MSTQVQLKAYAKVDATSGWPKSHPGLPVLVRVVAPPGMKERAPIDLVAVLDVSCGGLGPANRMALLKKAMEHVIEKLSNQDRLAVVPVQTSAVQGNNDDLIEMNEKGRTMATSRVQSLAVSGETKLSTALKKAVGILEGRKDQEKKKSAGFIIVISDGDDSSIFQETMTPTYSVHAFGFRDAHNANAMHYIANNSRGTYGILDDEHDQITDTFMACVMKITSVVAFRTKIDIMCNDSSAATLSAIESGRFKWDIEDNRKNGHVSAAALEAGAVRNFIVYVDNVGNEYNELPSLLSVRVEYEDGQPAAEGKDQEVKFVNEQVVVVRNGDTESKEVAAEIVRVEAVRIVGDILNKYKENVKRLVDIVDELHQHWLRLKDSDYGREASAACLISGLATEMQEMETSMRRCSGLPYMLSWHTCHTLQHQTRTVSTPSTVEKCSRAAAAPPTERRCEMSGAAACAHCAAYANAAGAIDCGGGSRKRKCQHHTELGIEQRLAYWCKVKCDLLPMLHVGTRDCPDQITMLIQETSRECIDRAMFHDVYLAVVEAKRRGS